MAAYESLQTLLLQKREEQLKMRKQITTDVPRVCIDNILGHPAMLAVSSTSVVS
jgi:hypothetical protein